MRKLFTLILIVLLAYFGKLGSLHAQDMYLDTAYAEHYDTSDAFAGQNYVHMLTATIEAKGNNNPLSIDTIWFQLDSSTKASDIKAIRFYHTYRSPMSINDTIGEKVIPDANGMFYFLPGPGSVLSQGKNVIHVGVDIAPKATTGNIIDFKAVKYWCNDTLRSLGTEGKPGGERTIIHPTDYTKYCDVERTATLNFTYGIRRVLFETIDNQTATTTGMPCLFVYKTPIPTVYKQISYPITVRHGELNSQSAAIWVDWNNDGYYDQSKEFVMRWTGLQEGSISKGMITIPCDATAGIHRMRVVGFNGGNPPLCGTHYNGEYEEYFFNIAEEANPTVSFTVPATVYQGALTKFHPVSDIEGMIRYIWDYDNDGNWDDTTDVGAHQYNNVGSETVKMKAELVACDSTIYTSNIYSATFSVVKPQGPPVVNFISNLNTITKSIPIEFTDLTSNGPHSWKWIISPDTVLGNPAYTIHDSDTDQEPWVEFHELGIYDVTLIAENINGADTIVKEEYISVYNEKLMCTDTSTQITSGYLYDDGGKDGNYYQVPLGLNNSRTCGFRIHPKCAKSITLDFLYFDMCSYGINYYCPGNADYVRVYDGVDNTGKPLHKQFVDMFGNSIYPDGFTNGGGNVLLPPPPSVTATSGTMYVEMFLNCGATGTGFEAKWSTQLFSPTKPKAGIVGPTTAITMKPVTFESNSEGYLLDYAWDMDGNGYSDPGQFDSVATFSYPSKGKYTVRLIVTSCDQMDTVYHTINVIDPPAKPSVDFEANYKRITMKDVTTVMDKSDTTVYDWKWEISPSTYSYMHGSHENSQDIHLKFDKLGYYTIKLIATNALGQDSVEKVDYIYVYENCQPGVGNLSSDIGFSEVAIINLANDSILYNQSSIGVTGYTDYSKTNVVTLYKTGTYTLALARQTRFNNTSITVWIDFNMDGAYDDQTERIVVFNNSDALSWTKQFTISKSVEEGLTKMRVAANAGLLKNTGCGPNYTGEFEDYGVIISHDDEPPVITLTGADTFIVNSCKTYSEPGFYAWDDVSGDLTSEVTVKGTSSINTNQQGDYPVTYDVEDNANNAAETVTRVVRVLPDLVPPVITIAGNNPDSFHVNSGTYTDPGYTAFDSCSGLKSSSDNNMVNTSVVGTHYIQYIAEDVVGNVDTQYRYVVVFDSVDPGITLNGKDTVHLDVFDTYNEAGVTITDNYDNDLVEEVNGSVNTDMLGTYFISYCVTDKSNNGPVCTARVVIVEDNEAPTLTFDQYDYTIEVFSSFNEPTPMVADNYWEDKNILITKVSGQVNTEVLGDYELVYKATDASGNATADVKVTVHVVDTKAPYIELLGSSMVNILRWTEYTEPGLTYRDNYYDKEDITINYGGSFDDSLSPLEVGLYNITYEACDPSGNCSDPLARFVYVEENVSIEDADVSEMITFYPNPVRNEMNIELDLPMFRQVTISIYNTVGEHIMDIYEGSIKSENFQVDVSELSSGMYYIRMQLDDQEPVNKKFVITK